MKLLEFNPEVSLDRISFTVRRRSADRGAREIRCHQAGRFWQTDRLHGQARASADIALPEALLVMPWGMNAETAKRRRRK